MTTLRTHPVIHTTLAHSLMLGGLAISITACNAPPPPQQTPEVTTAAVITRQINDWDEYTGHFESANAVEVKPRVSGYIQRVAFAEGATVHQGDLLFTIDPRPYAAEVARAQADVDRAHTRKRLADAELSRAKQLLGTQAISREEFDARTSGLAEGDAEVRAAEAALETAKLNLEWTQVHAPISGRISRAEVTPGNLVQAGPPAATILTTIVSLDPIYVYFDGDEQAYLKYVASPSGTKTKRPVYIGLTNETGFPHEGAIDFVDNRIDPSAGTIRLRAVLPNPLHQFTPGLFARVKLVGGTQYNAALIRDQAIGTDQDKKFVLILKPDHTVEYREVKLGPLVDGLRVVTQGLAENEQIVINGLQHVRPGMKVVAKTASMLPDSMPVAANSTQVGH